MKLYRKLRKIMLASDVAIVNWVRGPVWTKLTGPSYVGRRRTPDGHLSTMESVTAMQKQAGWTLEWS